MRRSAEFALAAALVCTIALAAPAAWGSVVQVPPGTYTHAEALAVGLIEPDLRALPLCPRDYTSWPGFGSETEAEGAFEDDSPAVCTVDPRDLVYTVPERDARQTERAAGANWRFMGPVTSGFAYEGGRLKAEVGNPAVAGSSEFVYVRTVALTQTCGIYVCNSVQSGWEESNQTGFDQDVRTAVSFADCTPVCERLGTGPYVISVGSYYNFRARHCASPGIHLVCSEIYWDGAWRDLGNTHNEMRCENSNGTGNCSIESLTEVYSADATWPDMNAPVDGTGVNINNVYIQTGSGTWALLNSSNYSVYLRGLPYRSADSPYYSCPTFNWYNFRATKGNNC